MAARRGTTPDKPWRAQARCPMGRSSPARARPTRAELLINRQSPLIPRGTQIALRATRLCPNRLALKKREHALVGERRPLTKRFPRPIRIQLFGHGTHAQRWSLLQPYVMPRGKYHVSGDDKPLRLLTRNNLVNAIAPSAAPLLESHVPKRNLRVGNLDGLLHNDVDRSGIASTLEVKTDRLADGKFREVIAQHCRQLERDVAPGLGVNGPRVRSDAPDSSSH